jgi:hypothetical protein
MCHNLSTPRLLTTCPAGGPIWALWRIEYCRSVWPGPYSSQRKYACQVSISWLNYTALIGCIASPLEQCKALHLAAANPAALVARVAESLRTPGAQIACPAHKYHQPRTVEPVFGLVCPQLHQPQQHQGTVQWRQGDCRDAQHASGYSCQR